MRLFAKNYAQNVSTMNYDHQDNPIAETLNSIRRPPGGLHNSYLTVAFPYSDYEPLSAW